MAKHNSNYHNPAAEADHDPDHLNSHDPRVRHNDPVPQLEVEYHRPGALRPAARRLRRVEPDHLAEVAQSIERLGFSQPILITGDSTIVDGHVRVAAARELGLESLPCIRVDHLSEDEVRLLRISLNKLQEKGSWDEGALKLEFEALYELELPVEVTGFETPEIDIILTHEADEEADETATESDPELNDVPEGDPEAPAVARDGDIWQLGEHRIACADTRDEETMRDLVENEEARMVFTDPPYNVPVNGHVCGKGKIQHEEFAMASGEMSPREFSEFLEDSLAPAITRLLPGGLAYVFMDWRHNLEMLAAAEHLGLEQVNLCIWDKGRGGMGSLYRSQHELVFVFCNAKSPAVNNVALGKHGRNRTNLWRYPGVNGLDPERRAELAMHPTVKPVELVADAIRDASRQGEIVLDPFLGSGTTVIAAEISRRRAYAVEYEPRYVDTAIRRWEAYTGKEARLVETGETLAAVTNRRALEAEAGAGDSDEDATAAGDAA